MDGNIGIGGDPHALLVRCAELIAPDGALIVEVDVDPDLDDCAIYTAVGDDGLESGAFPWARVGSAALVRVALRSGLILDDAWAAGDRRFVALRRAPASTVDSGASPLPIEQRVQHDRRPRKTVPTRRAGSRD